MSIPTTLLIMASSASTATPVPSSTSSTKLEFIGTEIDGQDGVHRTAATSGNAVAIVGEVQATGLPNPWADIWPGSVRSPSPLSCSFLEPSKGCNHICHSLSHVLFLQTSHIFISIISPSSLSKTIVLTEPFQTYRSQPIPLPLTETNNTHPRAQQSASYASLSSLELCWLQLWFGSWRNVGIRRKRRSV